MASAQMKMQTEPEAAARRWRTITLILLVIALAGAGWVAWQSGLLAPFLGQSAATGATAGAMPGAMPGDETMQRPAGAAFGPPGSEAAAPAEDTAASDVATGSAAAGSAAAETTGATPAESASAEAPARPSAPPADAAPPAEAAAPAEMAVPADAAEAAVPVNDSGLLSLQSSDAGIAAAASAAGEADVTETIVASIPAITRREGVTLIADDGATVATLASGIALRATGRSASGEWLTAASTAGSGWVQASQVIAYGLSDLTEVELPQAVEAAAQAAAVAPVAAAPAEAAPESAALAVEAQPDAASPASAASPAGVAQQATIATTSARLNIRSAPGTESTLIAKATTGDLYDAIGRNEASDWLLLAQEGSAVGWAAAAYVQLSGEVADLPVSTETIDAPPLYIEQETTQSAPAPAAGASASRSATAAAVAADGLTGTIVFQQSPGGMIYAYHLETGALQALTYGFDPAISPDGTQVAFVREGGEAGLYLIDIDGSNERVIFDERGSLSSPKWSVDGSRILFARNDEYIECYQIGQECLIPSVAEQRMPPEMLEEAPITKEYEFRLSVVNADGSNFHDVPALASAKAPDWSAAGIVYQSKAGLQRTADVENVTTQELAYERLGPVYIDPDWQPNGDQIVFQIKGAAQWDLWLVNSDGSGMHGITKPATTLVESLPSNVAAAWSPDGEHIVFLSNRTDENTAGDWRIWVMDADGSNQRALPIDIPIEYTYGAEQVVSWGG